MIHRIIFKPEAELDIVEAYEWYEEREMGLGAEFMRCVDSCVHEIQRYPEMYPLVHKNIRQGVTRRFPYSLFYFSSDDTLYIVSVFHASRNPQIWKERQ